jgi:3',5'-cyclic AMP phosphodiesterase CpdA
MSLLLHLSDLHLRGSDPGQALVLDKLVDALRAERDSAGARAVSVVITGDIFDSAGEAPRLLTSFFDLHARILDALGAETPTVVLPGNHDRRWLGFVGPHRTQPFRALARAAQGRRIFVAGTQSPILAEIVPEALHGLPAHVVAYDSTYLPDGLIGAGGTLRLEDLLQVHAQLPDDDRPLVVLMHHHLIPTPVTDVSGLDHTHAPRIARWLLRVAVPALVSHGDREELTMTALGAGTALSTLHAFGRPVLLLHGHKHVPTARLLRGMTSGCGDLLLASAGTAARRERVHAARDPEAARLWPSFNVIELQADVGVSGRSLPAAADVVRIESVSFFPKRSSRPSIRRLLAHVRREGPKWELESGTFRVEDPAPRVRRDEARFVLSPSTANTARWDFFCERTVELVPGARLRRYVEFVPSGNPEPSRARRTRRAGRRVELRTAGTTAYAGPAALCRTREEASRSYGADAAFESVSLLCRYGAQRATLSLSKDHLTQVEPFASVTDLTTGRERPVRIVSAATDWMASAENCAPRSLLRIYWALPASDDPPSHRWNAPFRDVRDSSSPHHASFDDRSRNTPSATIVRDGHRIGTTSRNG